VHIVCDAIKTVKVVSFLRVTIVKVVCNFTLGPMLFKLRNLSNNNDTVYNFQP